MQASRPMWIIVELDELRYRKKVHETVVQIIQQMNGEVVKSGGIGDLCVLAKFSHRKCKAVEKAIAAALNTLPVKRTIVASQDPWVLRAKTSALTMELYRRQDEVIGLSARRHAALPEHNVPNSSPNAGASTFSPKYFNSLADYERWAASASQQEREAYWDSLSDLDFARLSEDLEPKEEDHFSMLAQAEPQPDAVTPIDPRPDSFDTYEDYKAFYPDALVLTEEKWLLLKAGLY